MKKKTLAFVLALVLVAACSVGGTLAWLTAQTGPVVNTFTVGDINISLTETTGTLNATSGERNYKFVPGDVLGKDPKVTVEAGSEACYLFVHVADANNTITGLDGNVIQWSVRSSDPAWQAVSGHSGYWYIEVSAETAAEGESYYILTGGETENTNGQVTVNGNVTKAMVESLSTSNPTITITAAAVQSDNVTNVADAWGKLPTDFTGATTTTTP